MTGTTRIVLTTDFSDEAEKAYAPAMKMAERLGAKVDVVHVVEELLAIPYGAPFAPPLEVGLPDLSGVEDAARKHMDETVRKLTASVSDAVSVEGHVLRGERAGRVVCDYAVEAGADYIALSTHGRTGIRRMIMGSIAEDILRRTRTPVLIYPQDS